jgi:hypothetical protein
MSSILDLLTTTVDLPALALLAVFAVLFVLFTALARSGRGFPLRPITAYQRLRELASQATETGASLHVALGSGQLEGQSSAQAQAALAVLGYLANHIAHTNGPVQATASAPALVPAAQGLLQQAERAAGYPCGYTHSMARFSGPDPLAMALGANRAIDKSRATANVMLGRIGPEALLVVASHQQMEHVLGSDDLADAAVLYAADDDALIGEEIMAAGAYLGRTSHLGSLAAQDVMRVVIMISILVGVVAATLRLWG